VKNIEFDLDAKAEMMEASRFYKARGIGRGVSIVYEVKRALRFVARFPDSGFALSANGYWTRRL
jgi:hypothetical protein